MPARMDLHDREKKKARQRTHVMKLVKVREISITFPRNVRAPLAELGSKIVPSVLPIVR